MLNLLQAGDNEGAARQFVETVAFGPGAWERLPEPTRQTWVANTATFLSDSRDPSGYTVELGALASFPHPLLLTRGDQSMRVFGPTVDALVAELPGAETWTYTGAGHVPQVTHPAEYVATLTAFVDAADAA